MNTSSIFAIRDVPFAKNQNNKVSLSRYQPAATSAARAGISGTNSLNKEDFLQLLMAQMKNQNPLEPMNNQEFIAQLTSFSSLEQLENLNKQVSSSVQLQKSQNNAAAMSLIGKKIKAPGNIIELSGDSPVNISYELQSDADVTINIYDNSPLASAKGKLVKTINAGIQKAGANNLVWDGKTASGKSLPEGTYTYEIISTGPGGAPVGVKTFLFGQVSKAQFENGDVLLFVGNKEVALSDVYTVESGKGEIGRGK